MTSTDSRPAQAAVPHPVILRVCAALVLAAVAVLLALTLLRGFGGPDVAIGTVTAMAFVAIVLGGIAGLVTAQRMIDKPKAHTADLAAVVFGLTFIAVPFLLYFVGAAIFMVSFSSSYQF
jgi:hypothetical protein